MVGTWDGAGVAEVLATGADAETVIAAGLRAVLAVARGTDVAGPEAAGSVAAPIRGQGDDLATVFAELANDLLAQLDANGPGLAAVRLDGLLETDTGGYTAWGYAEGVSTASPPPVNVSLEATPVVTGDTGALTLRFRLRRETAG